jgi:hypothetical protein
MLLGKARRAAARAITIIIIMAVPAPVSVPVARVCKRRPGDAQGCCTGEEK